MADAPRYLFDAKEKPSLDLHEVPLIEASNQTMPG